MGSNRGWRRRRQRPSFGSTAVAGKHHQCSSTKSAGRQMYRLGLNDHVIGIHEGKETRLIPENRIERDNHIPRNPRTS